jgi:hypothetical protein
MNLSEKVFIEYLNQSGLKGIKISTSNTKTPDYLIEKDNNIRVIAEVKEFGISQEEKASYKSNNKDIDYPENKSWDRIRDKIKGCSKQLEACNRSTILILDNVTKQTFINLSTKNIIIAMFGNLKYLYGNDGENIKFQKAILDRNSPSQITRKINGSNISAVGVLDKIEEDYERNKEAIANNIALLGEQEITKAPMKQYSEPTIDREVYRLRIVHNPYAKNKFPFDIFNSEFDEHWVYENNRFKLITKTNLSVPHTAVTKA